MDVTVYQLLNMHISLATACAENAYAFEVKVLLRTAVHRHYQRYRLWREKRGKRNDMIIIPA